MSVPENVISQLESININLVTESRDMQCREANSSDRFQITITPHGGKDIIIGNLAKRNRYTVYDMMSRKEFGKSSYQDDYAKLPGFSRFKKLEGTYSSLEELRSKIRKERNVLEKKIVGKRWKCLACNHRNEACRDSCSECMQIGKQNIFKYLLVFPDGIYCGSIGGSCSEIYPIGKIRIN